MPRWAALTAARGSYRDIHPNSASTRSAALRFALGSAPRRLHTLDRVEQDEVLRPILIKGKGLKAAPLLGCCRIKAERLHTGGNATDRKESEP